MDYITIRQAADLLHVGEQIIRNLMASGAIPYIDAGPRSKRIPASAIHQLIQAQGEKK